MKPEEGLTVCKLSRKGVLLYGQITEMRTDGTFDFFTVEWSENNRVEYNTVREWGNSVYVPTCTVCDSEYHTFHPGE